MNTLRLPFGVQDCLPRKTAARNKLTQTLSKAFEKWGALPIEPPALDYADNFIYGTGAIPLNKMFKLTDSDGSLLVLRPDTTMQIARIASSKLYTEEPLKLYYNLNSYENNSGLQGNRTREFLQSGIEFFNEPSGAADAEVIELAVLAMKAAGIEDFQIEIGQVGFYKGLTADCGLTPAEEDELREYLNKKDMIGASGFLSGSVPEVSAQKILRLPGLFGGPEVIAAAAKVSGEKQCKEALKNLDEVYRILKAKGLDKYICFDLGLVSGAGYYSGVVFRGISKFQGAPLLEGGRYDSLTRNFGRSMPAIGFALGIDRVLSALENKANASEKVTIALAKGRLAEKAVKLLTECGVDCSAVTEDTRKLVLSDGDGKYNFIFVKPADAAVYVERGAADIGIVGKDTLLEDPRDVYELLDLGFAACRLSVAGKEGGKAAAETGDIRVATKYPEAAKRYYHGRGQNAEVIKLNGSVELAPVLGLSDVIVDIVESGNTLKANGLEEYAVIAGVSARLVVNKVSYKLKADKILPLIGKIERLI